LYSICDIDNPEFNHDQYKLYIFLNSYKISDKARKVIEEKIKTDGKTVLWIYAPNYVNDNGVSLDGMHDITGMNIRLLDAEEKQLKGGDLLSKGNVTDVSNYDSLVEVDYGKDKGIIDKYKFNNKVTTLNNKITTLFYIDDSQATVWGRYAINGKAALAYKQFENYNSFYSAVGNLSGNVLRNIAEFAGVHIYNYGDDPVYVNNNLIGVYSNTDGEINLRLKTDAEVEELFDGGIYLTENNILKISARKGEAKLFLLKRQI